MRSGRKRAGEGPAVRVLLPLCKAQSPACALEAVGRLDVAVTGGAGTNARCQCIFGVQP
jgi:hypothetical protein